MSIEISGPKGYEYQYLATVYAALSLYAGGTPLKNFYIENVNGEDAELIYQDSLGVSHSIEVQVKSDTGVFNLAFLADVLCHFGGRQSDHNLASRIIANKQKTAIIIAQGRCDDASANFLVDTGKFSRAEIHLPQNVNDDLIALVADYEKDAKTSLKIKRHQFCVDLAADLLDEQILDSLIQRVIIYEKLAHPELREKCQTILFKALNVPLLQTDGVLDDLIKTITEGRDSRMDMGAAFQKVIDQNQAARPEIKTNYLSRPEEQRLINELNKSNSLLLKGRSLCGKSSIAKAVSRHFSEQGYAYLLTSNFEDAERFLLSADKIDKVCLLDDPLGFLFHDSKSPETLQRLRHLRDILPIGRKLIVTANNDVLVRLNMDSDPDWRDLTVKDNQIAVDIWKRVSRPEMPAAIFDRIANFVMNCPHDKILQPGQLSYLANNWNSLQNNPDEDIWKFAAVDARLITDTIKLRGADTVRTFRTMALVCNTIVSVKLSELHYLFSQAGHFPGFRDKKSRLSGRSLMTIEDKGLDYFPKYPSGALSKFNWQQELDFLTKSGFLSYSADGYEFPHPVYCQAAQDLLSNLQLGEAQEVVADLKKAASLLAYENALIAAKMLTSIVNVNDNDEVINLLIQLAMDMEYSIYPSLIDESLIFLTSISSKLGASDLDKVQTRLTSSGIDKGSIRWHNGIPYIPNVRTMGVRLDLSYGKISDEEYSILKARLDKEAKPDLTAEEAWNFCNYLKFNSQSTPMQITAEALNKLMDYNETYIRSIASFHIFHQFSAPPEALVQKALRDPHPFVVLQSIKGFIRGWYNFDEGIKRSLLAATLSAFEKIKNVTAATNFITQFGIGYSKDSFDWRDVIPDEQQPEMWRLWGLFIVKFFEKVPSDIHFNTHRFIQTIQDAEKILSKSEQAAIAMAWLKWMRGSYKYVRYSDSLFYIGSFYLSFSEQLTAKERIEFVNLLIDLSFPYFTFNNVRLFLHKWNTLSNEEKAPLIKLAEDENATIFHAVVLTATKCPAELSRQILGSANWQDNPPDAIVSLIPRKLLEHCLSINFVTDQLMGLPYSSRKIWYRVLSYFLFKQQDILCKVAVKVLLDQYFYPDTEKPVQEWGNLETLLIGLIANPVLRDYIFYILLDEVCNENTSSALPLWKILKKSTDSDYHKFMKDSIIEHIKEIEMTDNLTLVFDLWGNKFFEKNFKTDTLIALTLKSYYDFADPDESLTEAVADLLEKTIKQSSPQLRGTMDKIISFAKKETNYKSLLEMAENCRSEYFKDENFSNLENLDRLITKDFDSVYINLT